MSTIRNLVSEIHKGMKDLSEWTGSRMRYITMIIQPKLENLDKEKLETTLGENLRNFLKYHNGCSIISVENLEEGWVTKVLIVENGLHHLWNALCFHNPMIDDDAYQINNITIHTYSGDTLELWNRNW